MNKKQKRALKKIIIAIVLIILVVIEGFYQMLGYLPIEKINIKQTVEMIQSLTEETIIP